MRTVEQATQKKRARTTPAKKLAKRRPVAASPKPRMIADPRIEFSNEEWQDMVATAAYYRAEARGFDDGSADEDWYEAEAELRERFNAADSGIETDLASGGAAADIETTGE
jgi:hypothetical protein